MVSHEKRGYYRDPCITTAILYFACAQFFFLSPQVERWVVQREASVLEQHAKAFIETRVEWHQGERG